MRKLSLVASSISILACLCIQERGEAQVFRQSIQGGSVPGQVTMRAGPSIPAGAFGVVFISLQTISIPLFPLDPSDPRSLSVGLELGSLNRFGLPMGGGVWDAPSLGIPNDPSFFDGALYFQSTFIPGRQFFIGDLSAVSAVRFGPSGQFRDRGQIMSSARAFVPGIELPDGRGMILGGGSGGLLAQLATSQVDFYDPVTDTYDGSQFMINARSLHTATVLVDGRIFICGGVDQSNDPSASTEIYDPATGNFSVGPTMAVERMGHTATQLNDGRVLIAGGLQNLNQPTSQLDPIFSSQATTEIYDPFAGTIVPGPMMREERAAHLDILLDDGRVLLCGGVGFRPVIFIGNLPTIEQTCDIFDPVTNQITAGPDMMSRRAAGSIVEVAPGRHLLAGGIDDLDLISQGTPTATAEIFDEATGTWQSTGSMAAARALHRAHPIGGGRFVHIGGNDGSVLAPNSLSSCEIYDVATGSFSAAASLPQPLSAYGSYVTSQGTIHLFGGSNNQMPGVVTSTLWYFP